MNGGRFIWPFQNCGWSPRIRTLELFLQTPKHTHKIILEEHNHLPENRSLIGMIDYLEVRQAMSDASSESPFTSPIRIVIDYQLMAILHETTALDSVLRR